MESIYSPITHQNIDTQTELKKPPWTTPVPKEGNQNFGLQAENTIG